MTDKRLITMFVTSNSSGSELVRKNCVFSTLVFVVVCLLLCSIKMNAQDTLKEKAQTPKIYSVETKSGDTYVGEIVTDSGIHLVLKTNGLEFIDIDKSEISTIKEVYEDPSWNVTQEESFKSNGDESHRLKSNKSSHLQNHASILSIGLGVSLGFEVIHFLVSTPVPCLGCKDPIDLEKVSSSPVIAGSIEHSFPKRFSLGLAISYQDFHVTHQGSLYRPDVYTRTNYALRGFYNIRHTKQMYMYCGGRLGYTFWTLETADTLASHRDEVSISNRPSFQVLFGFKYFFTRADGMGLNTFGIGCEAAFGTAPYFFSVSICQRFGSKN